MLKKTKKACGDLIFVVSVKYCSTIDFEVIQKYFDYITFCFCNLTDYVRDKLTR